ncbi:MAG: hypothetical protein QXG98_01710 [Candidatus Micrarchaeia archaeon]
MARAQAGMEYVLIVAAFLIVLIPVTYLAFQTTTTSTRMATARIAVESVVGAADALFAQSPGARTQVVIVLPDGVNAARTYINGREVNVNVLLPGGGTADVFALAKGNLTGTMPTQPGKHLLTLTFLPSGTVNVSEG